MSSKLAARKDEPTKLRIEEMKDWPCGGSDIASGSGVAGAPTTPSGAESVIPSFELHRDALQQRCKSGRRVVVE